MPRGDVDRGSIALRPLDGALSSDSRTNPEPVPPTRREQATAAIPAKFRARARRDAAAFYLSQLAKGLLAGEVALVSGEQQMRLATSEFVVLEIEAKQKKRGNHVSVKLRWPRRPLIRIAAAGGVRDGR
jgi:amphi-Trp domain-containing protein